MHYKRQSISATNTWQRMLNDTWGHVVSVFTKQSSDICNFRNYCYLLHTKLMVSNDFNVFSWTKILRKTVRFLTENIKNFSDKIQFWWSPIMHLPANRLAALLNSHWSFMSHTFTFPIKKSAKMLSRQIVIAYMSLLQLHSQVQSMHQTCRLYILPMRKVCF